MAVYIALLRGVNVGGKAKVAMSDLRQLVSSLGFEDVRTLLQSGNVVFSASTRPQEALETLLEKETKRCLGLDTRYFLRAAAQWKAVVSGNPFPGEAKRDPGHLLATFLKAKPRAGAVRALEAAIVGSEYLRVAGREAYIVYPDGVGRSRLTNAVIEKKLETSATARNWNTVLKLAALASD